MVECLTQDQGTRGRTSPASLRCGPWARHIYPSLVLVQPRKTRPCLTERLLMGCKESNQTKKQNNPLPSAPPPPPPTHTHFYKTEVTGRRYICYNWWVRKYLYFHLQKFCLSNPMVNTVCSCLFAVDWVSWQIYNMWTNIYWYPRGTDQGCSRWRDW